MTVSFGLDLAGYRSGRSRLCMAESKLDGTVEATIIEDHAFDQRTAMAASLLKEVDFECETLSACLSRGSLYVDVPIDCAALQAQAPTEHVWQLYWRPVDYAFDALAPLATNIGFLVARFANVLRAAGDSFGDQVYETYPAASLELMGLPFKGYKSSANKNKDVAQKSRKLLSKIAAHFHIDFSTGPIIDHDDIDALVCALTGLALPADCVQGKELAILIRKRLVDQGKLGSADNLPIDSPRGYVLLNSFSRKKVALARRKYSEIFA